MTRPDTTLTPRSVRALSDVLDRIERAWYPNELVDISMSWDYQAWPVDQFMAGLQVCETLTSGRKFVDVGSGIGTKLALAAAMGWEASGVEFRPQYAAMTSYICPEARVYDIDARGFSGYDQYDVIYAYLPLRHMGALIERVMQYVKPSAVLFFPECDGLFGHGWVPAHDVLPLWVRKA